MKDYIFRLQLDIQKIGIRYFMKEYLKGFLYFFIASAIAVCIISIDSIVIIARSLTANDVMIVTIGAVLWILVAVETFGLMLPESDDPYDWQ